MPSGLDPVAAEDARVLILGSLPGRQSVERHQYYANDRNAFWFIVQQLFGVDRGQDYGDRIAALTASGVALWDVLASAERYGSLDSAIARGTEIPNDIVGFLASHPDIRTVILNGGKAARLYRKHVADTALAAGIAPRVLALPSTSPANTRYTVEQKIAAWSALGQAARGI